MDEHVSQPESAKRYKPSAETPLFILAMDHRECRERGLPGARVLTGSRRVPSSSWLDERSVQRNRRWC